MSALRFGVRLVKLFGALAAGLLLHGLWRLFRAHSPWPRRFLGRAARIIGARPRVLGEPLRERVVFVSNHLSWIDIPLLAGATGTAFVSKAEVRDTPLVGWLADLNRTVYVSREDRLGVAEQIARVRAALDEMPAVTLFPEGTTGDGRTLLPFKASLLAMLAPPPPGVRVQPVRIDYGEAAELAWVGEEPGVSHARRVLIRPGRFTATLHFLEPFDPAEIGDRKAIAAEARRRIEAASEHPVSGSLSQSDLESRRPVWEALSDLFLDTDVSLLRERDARLLAASPYTLEELDHILTNEVAPVCKFNLWSIAGEWAGFDQISLEREIFLVRARGGRQRRPLLVWKNWLLLRAETERLRGGARGAGQLNADYAR